MPYRAIIATVVTVALALLAVGMWASVVGKLLVSSHPPATTLAAVTTLPGVVATAPDASVVQLKALTRAVLILSFVLIMLLLFVGLVATAREWIRVKRPGRPRIRTRYVDAWKIAGQRMQADGDQEKPG